VGKMSRATGRRDKIDRADDFAQHGAAGTDIPT
jgi:hypothetical protein